MGMLNETNDVRMIRNHFLRIIERGNCQAMCKMKYWAQLKNAIVREAFRFVGQSAPYEALEAFGLAHPHSLVADLKELCECRKTGRISEPEYETFVHALREDMLTLHAHGDIDDATRTTFETIYAANNNGKESQNAKDK